MPAPSAATAGSATPHRSEQQCQRQAQRPKEYEQRDGKRSGHLTPQVNAGDDAVCAKGHRKHHDVASGYTLLLKLGGEHDIERDRHRHEDRNQAEKRRLERCHFRQQRIPRNQHKQSR